jgi:hypothetical protein
VRAGRRIHVKLTLQKVRGPELTRTYTVKIPANARKGRLRLQFIGHDVDSGDSGLATIIIGEDDPQDTGGDAGPRTLKALARQVARIARYDGVTLRIGRSSTRAFRDDALRISGHAEATVRATQR